MNKLAVKLRPVIFLYGLVSLVLCQESNNRLPTATYPIEYSIWLHLSPELDKFNGHVEIKIGVSEPTSLIILYEYDLDIETVELFEELDDETLKVIKIEFSKQDPYSLYIEVDEGELNIDEKYLLIISFGGYYTDSRVGISKSTFANGTGDKISMITTNFLPQYARMAFPCYDEPHFKTPFIISIQHPVGYKAISNMGHPIKTATFVNTEVVNTTFDTTPSLSTHSIAFAVVSYDFFCNQTSVKICVYYDALHTEGDVQLVLETAEKTIEELENYLGVPLDLSKLDIVPDKNDTNRIGGNYGLLINKDTHFYYNPVTSGPIQKDLVIRHTIRQIVDIYFINVISPEWWNDIWISDGISVVLEHIVADKLYPELNATGQFIDSLYQSGFIQAILKPNGDMSYEEITNLVSGATQYKSAGIMHMLKSVLSEERFTKGLKTLLTQDDKLYSSLTFCNIFQQQAVEDEFIPTNYNLATIMNGWITEVSYPILNAVKTGDNEVLTQQNVLVVYDSTTTPNIPWFLPYNFIIKDDDPVEWSITTPYLWIDKHNSHAHNIKEQLDEDKWIIYNKELSGFYHTNYDYDNWNLIAAQLDSSYATIPMISRTQLVHDSILFALNGQTKLDVMFKIANYLNREVEYAPISRFLDKFMELDAKIFGTAVYTNVTKYVQHKVGHLYDRVRITNLNTMLDISLMDAKMCKNIIEVACYTAYQHCLDDTNRLVATAASKDADEFDKLLDSEFGYSILTYGLESADKDLFWKIVDLYNGDENDRNQEYISDALGYVRDAELIDHLLDILTTKNNKTINEIVIKLQPSDRVRTLRTLATRNPSGLDKTLVMLKTKPDAVKEIFEGHIDVMLVQISSRITTEERLGNFTEVLDIYKAELSDESSHQKYLDIAQAQVEWANTKIPEFQTTLSKILDTIADEENTTDDDDDDDGGATLTISSLLIVSLLFVVYLCGEL